jgi:hypothetical protein
MQEHAKVVRAVYCASKQQLQLDFINLNLIFRFVFHIYSNQLHILPYCHFPSGHA